MEKWNRPVVTVTWHDNTILSDQAYRVEPIELLYLQAEQRLAALALSANDLSGSFYRLSM